MLAILRKKQVHHRIKIYGGNGKRSKAACENIEEELKPKIKLIQLGETRVILPGEFESVAAAKRFAKEHYGITPSKIVEE